MHTEPDIDPPPSVDVSALLDALFSDIAADLDPFHRDLERKLTEPPESWQWRAPRRTA